MSLIPRGLRQPSLVNRIYSVTPTVLFKRRTSLHKQLCIMKTGKAEYQDLHPYIKDSLQYARMRDKHGLHKFLKQGMLWREL